MSQEMEQLWAEETQPPQGSPGRQDLSHVMVGAGSTWHSALCVWASSQKGLMLVSALCMILSSRKHSDTASVQVIKVYSGLIALRISILVHIVYSFIKHLLGNCHAPETFLGACDTSLKKKTQN